MVFPALYAACKPPMPAQLPSVDRQKVSATPDVFGKEMVAEPTVEQRQEELLQRH